MTRCARSPRRLMHVIPASYPLRVGAIEEALGRSADHQGTPYASGRRTFREVLIQVHGDLVASISALMPSEFLDAWCATFRELCGKR